jgi:5-formyltetrahydrofolate cyclo-ligase
LASFVSSIDPPRRAKPVTRRLALRRRDGLAPAIRRAASSDIARRTFEVLAERGPRLTVALYAAKGSEVDVHELAEALASGGHRVVYPRVVDDTRVLAFHAASESELIAGRFGLREPLAHAPLLELEAIDAFVVPGLAFDRTGGRVGWGRGHYDATLAAAPGALRVGAAFECQLVDQVPHDVHDVGLDVVVSELAVYRMTS